MFRPIIQTTPGQTATHAMTRGHKHLKARYSFCYVYEAPTRMDLCWCTVNYKRKHKQNYVEDWHGTNKLWLTANPSLRQVPKQKKGMAESTNVDLRVKEP